MYLYIFEDGSMTQTSSRPTDEDQDAIDNGYLEILYFKEGKFYHFTVGFENVEVEMQEADHGLQ